MAKPQPDSPGMATEPVPSQEVLPQWVEEETDHLLGKGASDRETWGLGKRDIL